MPHLIVGLGNPGPDYAGTRHNVGFMVVDALVGRIRAGAFESEGRSEIAWGQHKGQKIGLVKPQTYMNRSGDAVQPLMQAHDVDTSELLVVVDDVHLDVGQIRLRPSGSSGGHNGLQSVQERLGTTQYPRLRVGIGSDYDRGRQADYVLEPFTAQQRDVLDDTLIDACNAALTFIREGIEPAMNQFN